MGIVTERKALLDALDACVPALAANPVIPALGHFWFSNNKVMAFNDQLAISVPLELPFEGTISGNVLLGLLKASRAKEIEIIIEDENFVAIKAARARLRIPYMTKDSFYFAMPAKGKESFSITKEMLSVLNHCLQSVSSDVSIPDQTGITLINSGTDIECFSTNNATISYDVAAFETKSFSRVILSAAFCKELLSMLNGTLEINDNYALATVKDKTVFGKLIDSARPLPFQQLIKQGMTKEMEKAFFDIPPAFSSAVDRACVVSGVGDNISASDISMKKNSKGHTVMTLSTKSVRGEVVDNFTINLPMEDGVCVNIKVEPKWLRTKAAFSEMAVSNRCIIFANGNALLLVASV